MAVAIFEGTGRPTRALCDAMRSGAGRSMSDLELERLLRRMAAAGQVVEGPNGWRLAPTFAARYGAALRAWGSAGDGDELRAA